MRPISIPKDILQHRKPNESLLAEITVIKARFASLLKNDPEISIVIPAYNEEETILQTLASISASNTRRSLEVIVVNNNSKDSTEKLVMAAGVRCINETTQGITPARNAGLSAARGKFIINADADTIYPEDWVEELIMPLTGTEEIAVTYGRLAFIPIGKTSRFTYFFYEYLADFTRWCNKKFREEAVNVYGFSSAFRKEQGFAVNGFDHPPGTNEDGWLALKLRNKGFGKLYYVSDFKAMAWTTDRRIQMDGGLGKAILKRLKRFMRQ